MAKEYVRDAWGVIKGSYEQQSNGDIVVRDFHGRILGRYDAKQNVTRDFYGWIVAKGNAIGMLIK